MGVIHHLKISDEAHKILRHMAIDDESRIPEVAQRVLEKALLEVKDDTSV